MRTSFKGLFLILVITGFLCCENAIEPVEPIGFEDRDLNVLLMDLYLTNEVFPSLDYYYDIKRDLRMIDRRYGSTYPRIRNIKFRFPFRHNELLVITDAETRQLINSGEYHAWDNYNSLFKLDTLIDRRHYYQLRFKCCSHMVFLDNDYYSALPGFTTVTKNATNYPETNLIPRAFGDTLSYLYMYCKPVGWVGEGCEYREYYYFRFVERELDFVGSWSTNSGEARPDWYDEALLNEGEYYELFY